MFISKRKLDSMEREIERLWSRIHRMEGESKVVISASGVIRMRLPVAEVVGELLRVLGLTPKWTISPKRSFEITSDEKPEEK